MTRRALALLALAVLSFCSLTSVYGEEEDWYFPLAQGIYTEGHKFFNNDQIVILPGQYEKIQVGAVYQFYKKEDDKYIQVGSGKVYGVNFWESYAKITLLPGVESVTTNCFVKVKVDTKECFGKWMDYGNEYEKKGVFFDAFCAFYRATVYKPGDQSVRNAYLRNGYLHYLAEANTSFKKRAFDEAAQKFEFALLFAWPGGDVSEAERSLEICRSYNDRKKLYVGLMGTAKAAADDQNFSLALENYRNAFLNYTALYADPFEKTEFHKQYAACMTRAWTALSTTVSDLINSGKQDQAYYKLVRHTRYLAFQKPSANESTDELMKRAIAGLKPGTMAYAASASLHHIVSSQQAKGFFARGETANAGSGEEFLTGLALAALAANGHTPTSGQYRENVKKALAWVKSNIKAKGKLSEDRRISPQIALTFGLAEQYLATGDVEIHKILMDSFDYLIELQDTAKTLGQPLAGIDALFDPALLTLALGRARDAALDPNNAFLDVLKAIAYGRMDIKEKKPKDSNGNFPRANSEDEIYNYGAMLTMLRVTLPQFLTTETIDFVLKVRDFQPNAKVVSPEGWYFCCYVLSAFAGDQWSGYRSALGSTIAAATQRDGDEFNFPVPGRNGIFRITGTQGAAAFNALSLAILMNYEN